jgi:predicted Zn-dependent protease
MCRVTDGLFLEFKGHIEVSIVKCSDSAFALPNGRIYINQGLLAR